MIDWDCATILRQGQAIAARREFVCDGDACTHEGRTIARGQMYYYVVAGDGESIGATRVHSDDCWSVEQKL